MLKPLLQKVPQKRKPGMYNKRMDLEVAVAFRGRDRGCADMGVSRLLCVCALLGPRAALANIDRYQSGLRRRKAKTHQFSVHQKGLVTFSSDHHARSELNDGVLRTAPPRRNNSVA